MSCSWQITSWRSDSVSGRAIDRGTGVTSPTQWLDSAGQPFVIPPGPVWVEVLPLDSPLTVS